MQSYVYTSRYAYRFDMHTHNGYVEAASTVKICEEMFVTTAVHSQLVHRSPCYYCLRFLGRRDPQPPVCGIVEPQPTRAISCKGADSNGWLGHWHASTQDYYQSTSTMAAAYHLIRGVAQLPMAALTHFVLSRMLLYACEMIGAPSVIRSCACGDDQVYTLL